VFLRTEYALLLQLTETSVQASVQFGRFSKPVSHSVQLAPVKPRAQTSHRMPSHPCLHVQRQSGYDPVTERPRPLQLVAGTLQVSVHSG
jgi:hypothetical protein